MTHLLTLINLPYFILIAEPEENGNDNVVSLKIIHKTACLETVYKNRI
jgi:hypothetical protein